MSTAPRVDLRADFTGECDLNLPQPTPEGRQFFTLSAGEITADAESFFGRGFCHWFSGAVHSITGWNLLAFDYRLDGERDWRPAHTAALTPMGTVLDIFGERDPAAVSRSFMGPGVADTRQRLVQAENVPGDVLADIDHLRGSPLWWTEVFDNPGLQGMLLHFARLVVTRSGYRDCIRPEAQPPQHLPPAPPAPDLKGSTMTISENVAQLSGISEQVPQAALSQLANGTELLQAMQQISQTAEGLRDQTYQVLGETSRASDIAAAFNDIRSALERAQQQHQQMVKELQDAATQANRAKTLLGDAVMHHSQ